MRICLLLSLSLCLALTPTGAAADEPRVGPAAGGGFTLPSGQLVRPAGQTHSYSGRPVDLCLSPDGTLVYVKDIDGIVVMNARSWKPVQELPYISGAGSMHGIGMHAGKEGRTHVFVTTAQRSLLEATTNDKGQLEWTRSIDLPGPTPPKTGYSHALGLVISADGRTAYVCLSRNNTVGVIDLAASKLIAEIPAGVCPYDIVLAPDGTAAYVSNFGGRRPSAGDKTEKSAGTDVLVDGRSIALSGTLTKIDLVTRRPSAEIVVGLHPTQMKLSRDGRRLFVAASNSDSVNVVDTVAGKLQYSLSVRPDPSLPFGSLPNALALSLDERTLFVANGGNNTIAVLSLNANGLGKTVGFIPTGWFPGGVVTDGRSLFIANVKGDGSRTPTPLKPGWNSTQVRGSVERVDVPEEKELAAYTEQSKADARLPQALAAFEKTRSKVAAVPVPKHVGDPSVIRHVVYVLKENRTYDQVFGDMGKGNSEPKLCIYGRDVTPNHHALAEQFVLLDNYYCNGIVSADGHQWATQGIVTDYQEKDFGGGHTRSYDFGTDPLCYADSNFIWDSVLLGGLSFRNYGEFDFPTLPGKAKNWYDVQKAWGTKDFAFKQSVELELLRKYTCPEYPGWQLQIPDVRRMEVFLKEFAQFEKEGDFPNFTIVYLPQDHTQGVKEGVPSPRAHVADNDLALGQLIEAISKSRFWNETCIFVNEDDPQNGFDHVDGHRSLCLVVSPYAKRNTVVSKFYNQTAVLHTMTRMLGLPPMNQLTAGAPTMEDCFTDKPDLHAYKCVKNVIPIDEPSKKKAAMTARELKLAADLDFTKPDQIEDDDLNELLWLAERPNEKYPKEWEGPHGRGLAALGLKPDPNAPKEK